MILEIWKVIILDKIFWDILFIECYYFMLRNSLGIFCFVSIWKRNGIEKVCDMSMVWKRVFIWFNSFFVIFLGIFLDEIFVFIFFGKLFLFFLEV